MIEIDDEYTYSDDTIDSNRFIELYDYFEETLGQGSQHKQLSSEVHEFNEQCILFDHGVGDIKDVIEEMADVFELMLQHIYKYEITSCELSQAILKKHLRTEERKRNGYYERKAK